MIPEPYEGQEAYIFISYAHRDREQVFQVLNALQERGYRFWYDDGIAPGSEWPEDIGRHLDGAAMVIAFVTPLYRQLDKDSSKSKTAIRIPLTSRNCAS